MIRRARAGKPKRRAGILTFSDTPSSGTEVGGKLHVGLVKELGAAR
jgi:hypothetical protein